MQLMEDKLFLLYNSDRKPQPFLFFFQITTGTLNNIWFLNSGLKYSFSKIYSMNVTGPDLKDHNLFS